MDLKIRLKYSANRLENWKLFFIYFCQNSRQTTIHYSQTFLDSMIFNELSPAHQACIYLIQIGRIGSHDSSEIILIFLFAAAASAKKNIIIIVENS